MKSKKKLRLMNAKAVRERFVVPEQERAEQNTKASKRVKK